MMLPRQPADPSDDDRWILRAQAGNPAAFAPLVDAHLAAVRAFIALRLPVPHLVDELAHETFVFAYRHLASFEAGTSFRAWLRAIAANLARAETQRFRRQETNRARLAAEPPAAENPAAPTLRETREAELLAGCLGQLTPELRRLLALKYTDEKSSGEIAGAFARSVEWVRVTLFRVRRQLRACIESKLAQEAAHAD